MKCIICYKNADLNTETKVKVGDKEYNVYLCNEHSETATMRQIKTQISEITTKLIESVQLAKEIGIDLGSILDIEVQTTQTEVEEYEINQVKQNQIELNQAKKVKSVPQSITPQKTIHRQPDVVHKKNELPDEYVDSFNMNTSKEMQSIEGRDGKPTVIPKKIIGKSGVTNISINRSITDQVLQERSKSLNSNMDNPHSFKDGYTISECRACGGSGIHPMTNETCPKCGGSGML